MECVAFLTLRITLAWMFLYPTIGLLRNWPQAVETVRLIAPLFTHFFSVIMILVMIFGSLSILFGFYAQIGGALLCIYSLIGTIVHYKLAKNIEILSVSSKASAEDKKVCLQLQELGMGGHITSAQKNFVIAASTFFIFLVGSGPMSLTENLF